MRLLKYFLISFLIVFTITGCKDSSKINKKSELPFKYQNILKDKKVYIASIGLSTQNFANYLAESFLLKEQVISLDFYFTNENLLDKSSIEKDSVLFLVLNYNNSLAFNNNFKYNEEIERAKSFYTLKSSCTIITVVFDKKNYSSNNGIYMPLNNFEILKEIIDINHLVIYIEGSEHENTFDYSIDSYLPVENFVEQYKDIDFLHYKNQIDFINQFIKISLFEK